MPFQTGNYPDGLLFNKLQQDHFRRVAEAGIRFQELHNARGRRLVMLLVEIDPGELPQRVDAVTAAERYLA